MLAARSRESSFFIFIAPINSRFSDGVSDGLDYTLYTAGVQAFSCIFTRPARIFVDYSQPVLHCAAVFRADLHRANRICSPSPDLYSSFIVNIHFGAYTFQNLPTLLSAPQTACRFDVGRVLAPAVPCWQIWKCYRKRCTDLRKHKSCLQFACKLSYCVNCGRPRRGQAPALH